MASTLLQRALPAACFSLVLLFASTATSAQVVDADIYDDGPTPAAGAPTLPWPRPSWYTAELHQRILAAGSKGVEVALPQRDATVQPDCLGLSPPSPSGAAPTFPAVVAGGCMVSPAGCTMNFIFSDGTSSYIGTAGHCLGGKGGAVVMQVATRVDPTDTVFVTLAKIGKSVKKADQGIGRDFGLVKIDPGWAVVPGVAGALGPTGALCLDPLGQPVVHYGHGYVFAVEQGVAKEGEVIPDASLVVPFTSEQYGYNWVGYGLPGDSGSPVMDAAGLAVGDLTHGLSVSGVPIPGLSFGTTIPGIFDILGTGYTLVTVDGRQVRCTAGSAVGL